MQRNCIPHRTLHRVRHIFSDPVALEVIHCHPNPETRHGLLSQHLLSVYLAPLSDSESYGDSHPSNRQQPSASIRRPTRFPTRTLHHFCFATTDEWYHDRFQPKETSTSDSLYRCWPDGGIRYSQPQRTVIEDCKITLAYCKALRCLQRYSVFI